MSDSITIAVESLEAVVEESRPLLQDHWEEIALNKDKIKLEPDWPVYFALASEGRLGLYTARDEGKLVGYFVVTVSQHPHYAKNIFAENDVVFLKKEYRKTGVGAMMIRFAEQDLRKKGVSVLSINTKVHQPFDSLMEALDFSLIERKYSKYIGD